MNATMKRLVERRIMNAAFRDIRAAGCTVTVDDGGDPDEWLHLSTDRLAVLNATFAVDGAKWIIFSEEGNARIGWIWFIMGNDGWDVIHDYANNDATNRLLKRAFEVADKYS